MLQRMRTLTDLAGGLHLTLSTHPGQFTYSHLQLQIQGISQPLLGSKAICTHVTYTHTDTDTLTHIKTKKTVKRNKKKATNRT